MYSNNRYTIAMLTGGPKYEVQCFRSFTLQKSTDLACCADIAVSGALRPDLNEPGRYHSSIHGLGFITTEVSAFQAAKVASRYERFRDQGEDFQEPLRHFVRQTLPEGRELTDDHSLMLLSNTDEFTWWPSDEKLDDNVRQQSFEPIESPKLFMLHWQTLIKSADEGRFVKIVRNPTSIWKEVDIMFADDKYERRCYLVGELDQLKSDAQYLIEKVEDNLVQLRNADTGKSFPVVNPVKVMAFFVQRYTVIEISPLRDGPATPRPLPMTMSRVQRATT